MAKFYTFYALSPSFSFALSFNSMFLNNWSASNSWDYVMYTRFAAVQLASACCRWQAMVETKYNITKNDRDIVKKNVKYFCFVFVQQFIDIVFVRLSRLFSHYFLIVVFVWLVWLCENLKFCWFFYSFVWLMRVFCLFQCKGELFLFSLSTLSNHFYIGIGFFRG